MKVFSILLSSVLCSARIVAKAPPAWTVDLDNSQHEVDFEAMGRPNIHYITGRVVERGDHPLKGRLIIENGKLMGSASVAIDGCKTGIPLQDQLARDAYLEIPKWPDATLSLDPVPLPDEFSLPQFQKEGMPFTGKLLLHGVERPLPGLLDLNRQGADVRFRFAFEVALQDYGIGLPVFFGSTIRNAVKVFANLRARLIPAHGSHE